MIIPGFEVGKAQAVPFPVQIFSYGDNPSSWPDAFMKAATALDLKRSNIGVESGELRVFELRLLEMAAVGAIFPAVDAILNSLRVCKDNNEIAAIQKAVDIAQEAFLATIKCIKIGMTELELASELTIQLLLAGSDTETAFSPIIASGPNSANPHATPSDRRLGMAFRYNPDYDTIDLGGHNFASSKKYRDALRYGRVALVVDDVLPPWRPRFVEVRGTVKAIGGGGKDINAGFDPEMLRLTPTYIVSIGINDAVVMPGQGKVNYSGRNVT